MFRRVLGSVAGSVAVAARLLTIDAAKRDDITKHLVALKEECKSQGLDLADMNDAAKDAGRIVQERARNLNVDDSQFTGKVATLSASVKAYQARLTNLQTEAQAIQGEVEAIIKLMWGTENHTAASFSSPPPTPEKATSTASDFEVEPPPIAKMVDDINRQTGSKVEHVEGEKVSGTAKPASSTSVKEEEIEVETIDIEVEPAEGSARSEIDVKVEGMKVTEITSDLFERGINFSDCLDAKSLRQRYKDVLSGKVTGTSYTSPKASTENVSQPPPPQRRQDNYQYNQNQSQPPPGSSGITADPYPNAHRKMVDPQRYVGEVKAELCMEKGIDPNSVDLWSGKVRLDDKKRLYDYPTVQSYPIEVRQKGDVPQ